MTIWSHLSIGSLLIAPGNTRSMSNLAEQELLETFPLTTSGSSRVEQAMPSAEHRAIRKSLTPGREKPESQAHPGLSSE